MFQPKKKLKVSNGEAKAMPSKPDLTRDGTLIMDEPQQTNDSMILSAPAQDAGNLAILALDDDDDNDEDMTSLAMIPRHLLNGHGYNMQFDDKASVIQYEMEKVSQSIIDKMSDPVNELGKFIQTLSVNKSIAMELGVDSDNDDDNKEDGDEPRNNKFMHQMKKINREKEKWQELLSENWHISKQNKSLVPLIRFLSQIFSPPDFNHIMPLCITLYVFVCICSY